MSKVKDQSSAYIRWMIRRDMQAALSISVNTSVRWVEEEFLGALRQRNCIGMVAELDEKVVGYFVYQLYKNRIEILNFAVDVEHRKRGIGQRMIDKLKSKLHHQRRNKIIIDVPEDQIETLYYFSKRGFIATELVRGRDDDGLDSIVMEYYL